MILFSHLIPTFTRSVSPADTQAAEIQPPARKPVFEIREADDSYALTVWLPGVAKDGLELTADGDQFTITAHRAWSAPKGWTPLHRETGSMDYALTLTHDSSVDLDKIRAELTDGVLRVTLPKAEALKPRKISVG